MPRSEGTRAGALPEKTNVVAQLWRREGSVTWRLIDHRECD
jgi:hypothetical protein